MSDKVSVTVRMEEERRDKWDEWVEEHPTIRARSVLIRRSVNKFMDEDPLHPNNENKKRKKIHNELQ